MNYEELLRAYNALKAENDLLKAENENLRNQLYPQPALRTLPAVHNNSTPEEKISLRALSKP